MKAHFFRICLLIFVMISLSSFVEKEDGEMFFHARVTDLNTKENLEFATVLLECDGQHYSTITDAAGQFRFRGLPGGDYKIYVSFVGYNKLVRHVTIEKDTFLTLTLVPEITSLREVVVTATESKGQSSSSLINRKAMEHLQPSGFADLLELLPGGMSKEPAMGNPSLIRLREVGISSPDYAISSLGTAFYIDGAPVSGNANMQYLAGANEQSMEDKDVTGRGVDMRAISTDEIERVEVVRGIPSVEYGDLTSGLIKIERKTGETEWNTRFKADVKSKLLYVGKGFELKDRGVVLNIGLDYLNSKIDPRSNLENYKRITGSARLRKIWHRGGYELLWSSNLDYTGAFDREKKDPDLNYQKEDTYRSSSNRLVLGNSLKWNFPVSGFFRSLAVNTSFSYQQDLAERVKFVQLSRDTPIPNSSEEGEHNGLYLPYSYTASQRVDGKPVSVFLKGMGDFGGRTFGVMHNLKAGVEWNLDKNLGGGQLFDATRPVYPSVSVRSRAYRDIPAGQHIAFFAEDVFSIPVGQQRLNVTGGVRALSVLNLGEQYRMSGKLYWDPRVNVQWCFPSVLLGKGVLEVALNGGIGWHTKLPVLAQLYPDDLYVDLVQLNYFHVNPDYRRLNMLTRKISSVNDELEPARNRKLEFRLDVAYLRNQLSVTWFREELNSGFRTGTGYKSYAYKKYDNHSVDHSTLQGPPELEDMTWQPDTALQLYGVTTNGSRLLKEGLEFQFSSRRIESLRTRLTINGAWFRTTYHNSQPVYKRASVILDGKEVPYLGLYDEGDGYIREQLNTNFTFDTDVPTLGLNLSVSVQCLWFTASQTMAKNGIPTQYVNVGGEAFAFTEADKTHKERQWLVVKYNPEQFVRTTVPMSMNVDFKATKTFYNRLRLALFVNGMLDYYPDYKVNGYTIHRYNSPYFGMELNFRI